MNIVRKKQTADDLRAIYAMLIEAGWHTGTFGYGKTGSVCLVGGAQRVILGEAGKSASLNPMTMHRYHRALKYMYFYQLKTPKRINSTEASLHLQAFNDRGSMQRVLNLLLEAAESLDPRPELPEAVEETLPEPPTIEEVNFGIDEQIWTKV